MSDQSINKGESRLEATTSREEQLADGVLDRTGGENYNPNSDDVVANNRARFEAANAKIARDHAQLEEAIIPVIDRVVEEVKTAAADPAHQAMIPEQETHLLSDPPFQRAGKERAPEMPAHLADASLLPQQGKPHDAADPDGPAVPVRNHSLRKDQ